MRRLTSPLLVLLGGLMLVTGCSTVPSSSPVVQITQAPARPNEQVGIEPLPPEKGATPEEVVRGFIDAAASTVRGHPVARQHLAPQAATSWSDEAGITVISPGYATVTTDAGAVEVTGTLVGTVDQSGEFSVAQATTFTRSFALEKVKGEWRITDPPDGLIMLQPDFERLYDQLDAFFIDPTGQRVVPDPRYLITGEAQPTALVERVIAGPSPGLGPGVRNALSGARLRRAVTVAPRGVTVDLTGLGTPAPPVLSEICAQLVWTLNQLQARSVEILIDGEPVDLQGVPTVQTVDDWASFDPDTVPADAVGHYLFGGALHTVDGKPAPGPAGAGAYGLTSAAVSVDLRTGALSSMAGTTTTPTGTTLLSGPYGGELTPVISGDTLTAPTIAATRAEVWVVRDGDSVVRVPFGGPAQAVSAPSLPGPVRVLELSPDGVRAALVADGALGPSLYVGTVTRAEDGGVTLDQLQAIAPSLSQVIDVAWRSSSTLLVLSGDGGQNRVVPYSVSVDGWGLQTVPTAGLPSQPTAIAAAPGQDPLVSAGGTIWQLSGGVWVTLIRGQEPLPGVDPFYPL